MPAPIALRHLPATLGALLGVLGLDPGSARAGDPGQWAAAAGAGGALLNVDRLWRPGAQVEIEGRYGLAEFWALRGAFQGGWHPERGGSRPANAVTTASGTLGAVYAWDVLRWVPFAEGSLALAAVRGEVPQRGNYLGLQLGGGVSYLIDRSWVLSGCLRYHYFGVQLGGDPALSDVPQLLGLLVRLDRQF